MIAPVLKGMVERSWGPGYTRPETQSVRFRDEMVRHATELRLGIDYLQERDDVDMDRLAYLSVSWGGGSRLGFAAVDDRYRAVVFIGGGIDERVKPTLPEADNVNFAPYIDVPKLLLNGRNDEEHHGTAGRCRCGTCCANRRNWCSWMARATYHLSR